ncbi:MAG: CAP domain-containing protein, partial [Desulfobacteraceae bacterium]|nr:CAP domain-containing protein [Desulfobacteraceae bacterium]
AKMIIAVLFYGFLLIPFCFGNRLFAAEIAENQESAVFDENAYLESLINQARKNPLEMAALIGKDPEQVIKDFSDKKLILSYGLPPVVHNKKLQYSAGYHSRDMIDNQYFAYQSIDGRKPIDRMQAAGYRVQFSGETLGMIGFYNLINSEEAVWAMFKKMFDQELDPLRKRPWVILNPAMSEIGVSIAKGAYTLGNQTFNAYLGVCDFGGSRTDRYAAERLLFHSINAARIQPDEAVAIADTRFQDAAASMGKENAWKLFIGLPPLAWNMNIHDISRQVQAEIANETKAVISDNSFTMKVIGEDVSLDTEYQEEATVGICMSFYDEDPDMIPLQAATKFFRHLIESELFENKPDNIQMIFNDTITEIGISIDYSPVENQQGNVWSAIIVGARPTIERQFVVGHLDIAESEAQKTMMKSVKEKIGRQMAITESVEIDDENKTIDVNDQTVDLFSGVIYTGPLCGFQFAFEQGKAYEMRVVTVDNQTIYKDSFKSFQNRNKFKDVCILTNE